MDSEDLNTLRSALEDTTFLEQDVKELINLKNSVRQTSNSSYIQKLKDVNENGSLPVRFTNHSVLPKETDFDKKKQVKCVNFFLKVTQYLEKIMIARQKNKDVHFLMYSLYAFRKSFVARYQNLMYREKQEQDTLDNHLTKAAENALKQVQIFLKIYLKIVLVYFNLENVSKQFQYADLLTRDHIWNFIVGVIFDQSLYTTIYELIKRAEDYQSEFPLQQLMIQCRDATTEDFKIRQYFALDPKNTLQKKESSFLYKEDYNTPNYIEGQSYQEPKLIVLSDTIQSLENERYDLSGTSYTYEEGQLGSGSFVQDGQEGDINQYDLQQPEAITVIPYQNTIDLMKMITYQYNPVHQLKVIHQISDSIRRDVDNFYKNENFMDEQESLTSQDYLAIITYIIAQSQLTSLPIHLKLIENFINPNSMDSQVGYYFKMVQSGLMNLKNFN